MYKRVLFYRRNVKIKSHYYKERRIVWVILKIYRITKIYFIFRHKEFHNRDSVEILLVDLRTFFTSKDPGSGRCSLDFPWSGV